MSLKESLLISQWEEWLNLVDNYGIYDIVLAGAAHHRQFPDENLDSVFDQETYQNITSGYRRFKELASEIGCSRENPSFFFIQHVYPYTLG